MTSSKQFNARHRRAIAHRTVLSTAASGALLAACSLLPGDAIDGLFPDGSPRGEHHGSNPVALTRARTCDEVLTSLQERAFRQILQRAEQMRQAPQDYYGEPGIFVDDGEVFVGEVREDLAAPSAPQSAANPLLAGNAEAAASADGSGGFSETTVQVADVDEADVVKADGDHIYLLQGQSLVKTRAWPAEELDVVAALDLEGDPIAMFVHDGKALVYSSSYRSFDELNSPNGTTRPYYYYGSSYVKVSLIDVSGDDLEPLREIYMEGQYVSSRRHADVVRTMLHDGYRVPSLDGVYIEYFTPFGDPYRQQDIDAQVDAWVERTTWAVSETALGDWMPRHYEVVNGETAAVPFDCENYHESAAGESGAGLTSVLSVSLDSDPGELLRSTSVSGRAERVYSNEDVVLLSFTDYGSYENDYREATTLHQFGIDGLDTPYLASGTLPGYINDQFSLDEYDGAIRVSTTENRWNIPVEEGGGSTNRVFTLSRYQQWLDVWGQTEVFGREEQIYSTRFVGDRGYVVTFRQTDPLFVLDLSNPGRPRVAGELHMPGFSNFLFPMGPDHLFAIGRDADERGFARGIALQVFDVSNADAPVLSDRYVYESDGYSEADFDHRALSFDGNSDRVAFPLTTYGEQGSDSSLEVFNVSAASGIARLGAIRPPLAELTLDECLLLLGYDDANREEWLNDALETDPELASYFLRDCSYNRESMRRGLFREDVTYGISTGAIYAHRQLDQPAVGQVTLPAGYYYGGYYGPIPIGVAGGSMGSGGGSAGGAAGSSFEGMAGSAGESMMAEMGTGGASN